MRIVQRKKMIDCNLIVYGFKAKQYTYDGAILIVINND